MEAVAPAEPTTRPTATSASPAPPSAASTPSTILTTVAAPTTTGAPAAVACPSIPAPVPDTGVGPAGLMVFDTATGKLAWEVEAAGSATIAPAGDVVVAGDDAATRAYRASDGSPRWCRAGGGLVAWAGGTVVVLGSDGRLVGLDPATGAELWTSSQALPSPGTPIGGLPSVLTGGKQNVYVDTSVTGPPGAVVAVDAANGATLWTWTPSGCQGGPAMACIGGPWYPTEAGLVYVMDTNVGSVVALDPASGAERWRVAVTGQQSGISASDSVVVVTSIEPPPPTSDTQMVPPTGELQALDPATGQQRWALPFTGVSASAAGDLVIVISQLGVPLEPPTGPPPTITTRIEALEAATGRQVWTRDLPNETPLTMTRIGDLLITESTPGQGFLALDARTGTEQWRSEHPSPFSSPTYPATNGYERPLPLTDGKLFASIIRSTTGGD